MGGIPSTKQYTDGWDVPSKTWVHALAHDKRSFGVTLNDITKGGRSASSPLPPTSVLCTELADLEPQEEDAPKHVLWYTPMSWLGVIRPHRRDRDESWSASLCQTFLALAVGAQIPAVVSLPAKKFKLDAYCCPFSLDRSGCPAAAPTSPPTSFFSRHLPESPLAPAPPTSKHTAPVASSSSAQAFAMRIPPCRTSLPPSSRETDAGEGRSNTSNPASVGPDALHRRGHTPASLLYRQSRTKSLGLRPQDLMGKRLRLCASASFKA